MKNKLKLNLARGNKNREIMLLQIMILIVGTIAIGYALGSEVGLVSGAAPAPAKAPAPVAPGGASAKPGAVAPAAAPAPVVKSGGCRTNAQCPGAECCAKKGGNYCSAKGIRCNGKPLTGQSPAKVCAILTTESDCKADSACKWDGTKCSDAPPAAKMPEEAAQM